jgi:hypothetical protein
MIATIVVTKIVTTVATPVTTTVKARRALAGCKRAGRTAVSSDAIGNGTENL